MVLIFLGDNSLLKSCSRAFEKYRQFSAILPSLDDSLSSDVTSGFDFFIGGVTSSFFPFFEI